MRDVGTSNVLAPAQLVCNGVVPVFGHYGLAIAESRHSDIGKLSFEQATVPIEKQVAEFLKKVMKLGALRTADPKVAAIHLLSLLESELLQRVLLGVIDTVKPEVLSGAVRRAVDAFLSGYGRR